MEQKNKTIKLSKDYSQKIIIILSTVIIILMSAVIVVASKKTPANKVNATITQTQTQTQTQLNVQQLSAQEALRHKVTETVSSTKGEALKDKEKTIYLTFDDGPSQYTPEILDILDKYGVKATFFVINSNYNQYMKDIVDRGHTIALHSYSHDYEKIYASETAYYNDLQAISDVVYNETGVRTNIMRFPGGGSNTISRKASEGIMSKVTKGVQEKGYFYFDWNVSSGDADGNNVAVDILEKKCKIIPNYTNTIIVLMHDTKKKRTTVDALSTIIENYKEMGYKFSSIDSTTPPVHHKVNN